MSVLVFGSTGQLGAEIIKQGKLCFGYSRRFETLEEAMDIIESLSPDVVVNCAAATDTRKIQFDEQARVESFRVNVNFPSTLASACKKLGVKFIHVSSNYVLPDDEKECEPELFGFRNQKSIYGNHKAMAEDFISNVNKDAMILRIGNLMGFNWRLPKLLDQVDQITCRDDVFVRPVSTKSTARFILGSMNLKGIVHYGSTLVSLREYLECVTEKLGKPKKIITDNSKSELSPINSWLNVHPDIVKPMSEHIQEAIEVLK